MAPETAEVQSPPPPPTTDGQPAEGPPAESAAPQRKPWLVIRPRSGWAALDLRELWRFRDLLLTLALRDIKLRYRQTVLGVAWVVLQPLLGAAIFAFVFGLVAKLPSEGIPYFVFAYAGLTAWTAFQTTFTKASTCLVQNANLVTKVYFPRLVLPLSTAFGAVIDFVCGLAMLVPMLAAFHVAPGWPVLLLPVWLALLLLLALGAGLVAAALSAQYRDVQYILPVVLQLAMYASPLAYALKVVPEKWQTLYSLNPLVGLLEAVRWSLLGSAAPPVAAVAYGATVAAGTFVGGAMIFRRAERRFADVL
ncbi:MAG TPA: ABC transporter permease [Gemmataceae bacterium]|nr:ABC transporter permease [Gemmataceae bacterium]